MTTSPQADPLLFGGLPFTTSEAAAEGLGQSRLRALVRHGIVRRMLRGVYVDADLPDSVELRVAAVLKVVAPDAIICRRTAAWLYGVDTFALQEQDEPPPIETLRPSESRATRLAGADGHVQTVLAGDVVMHHGVRVTSPLATAVHLARHLHRPLGLSALDAMCHAELITVPDLLAAVDRYPHHPGIVKARDLAGLVEPATESPPESWLRLRLVDAGLGSPVPQVQVDDGSRTYRVDLAYLDPLPNGRFLALEYDSDQWHSTLQQRNADANRRHRLGAVGWDVLSVRKEDVWGTDDKLERKVGELLGRHPRLPRQW
jgi:REase_MTES_1575/Transcriptional regulator, AbiEi antitoxin